MDEQRAPTQAERALLTEAEKIRIQYRNMPTAFVGTVVVASLMGIVLAAGTGARIIAIWLAAVYLWTLGRFFQWRAFNRADPAPHEMRRWRAYSVVGAAVAGLIWGVGALELYVPNGLAYQLFLVMGLIGMGAGSRMLG